MIVKAFLFALLLQNSPAVRPVDVAGQVQTREGFPAVAVRVSAIPAPPATTRAADGQNYWPSQLPTRTVLTNNEGRYRLTALPPGRYYLVAGMLGQATYYPATTDPERATVVTVGQDTTDSLDFKLQRPHGGLASGRVAPRTDGVRELAVLSGYALEELLEMPVAADGTFSFGHIPKGRYLVNLFPTPPGTRSVPFEVGDADVTVEFVRLPLRTVSGRIVVQNGPLPKGFFTFSTVESIVTATVNPDGTFTAGLQAGRHQAELSGVPVGYSIASVRAGAQDSSKGLVVGAADVKDVVITVAAPRRLPRLTGRIAGVTGARLQSARVELTGPILSRPEAAVQADGSFEFPAVPAGRYTLRVPQLSELATVDVVVRFSDTDVQVVIPAR